MRLEDVLVKHNFAATVKDARILIEKTRSEAGSNDDYYKLLYDRFNITKKVEKKKRFKPKSVRKFFKILSQIIITFFTIGGVVISGINKEYFLAISALLLGFTLVVILDKWIDNIDRNATFK